MFKKIALILLGFNLLASKPVIAEPITIGVCALIAAASGGLGGVGGYFWGCSNGKTQAEAKAKAENEKKEQELKAQQERRNLDERRRRMERDYEKCLSDTASAGNERSWNELRKRMGLLQDCNKNQLLKTI